MSYESFPLAPAAGEITDAAQKMRAKMAVRPPGTTRKRAVWIVHGMGQQVPFETLEQLAEGLISAAAHSTPPLPVPPPKFREVRVGATVLQRVELALPRPGADPQEVHLYECYWAPKTEGAVKLADVISFLWDGGTHGLANFFTGFARALFGNMIKFSLSWRTPTYLLVTLAVLAALTVINAIVVGMGASMAGISSVQKFVPREQVQTLTAVASMVCAVTITFGVTLFLAEMSRPTRGSVSGIRAESKRLDLGGFRNHGRNHTGRRQDHGPHRMGEVRSALAHPGEFSELRNPLLQCAGVVR